MVARRESIHWECLQCTRCDTPTQIEQCWIIYDGRHNTSHGLYGDRSDNARASFCTNIMSTVITWDLWPQLITAHTFVVMRWKVNADSLFIPRALVIFLWSLTGILAVAFAAAHSSKTQPYFAPTPVKPTCSRSSALT